MTEISGYDIDFSDLLGCGSFGYIYKASDRLGNRVAAKKIIVPMAEHQWASRFALELLNVKKLNHLNLLKLYSIGSDETHIYIFMEYCSLGNLAEFNRRIELTEREKLDIMIQITRGVEYLHNEDVIHRDIKPNNILVSSRYPILVKLADFDTLMFPNFYLFCSREDSDNQSSMMSSDVGTPAFKAPEFWQRDEHGRIHYHRSVDIFALGLTFLVILQRTPGPQCESQLEFDEERLPIGYVMYVRDKNRQPVDVVVNYTSSMTDLSIKIRKTIDGIDWHTR